MQLKLLAANVLSFVLDSSNCLTAFLLLRPSHLTGNLTNKSLKYTGAWQSKHLYTSVSILNCICFLTGSQCSSSRQSVLLSYLVLLSISFAQMFCILWNFLMSISGRSANMLLQQSKWDITVASNRVSVASSVRNHLTNLMHCKFNIADLHLTTMWYM